MRIRAPLLVIGAPEYGKEEKRRVTGFFGILTFRAGPVTVALFLVLLITHTTEQWAFFGGPQSLSGNRIIIYKEGVVELVLSIRTARSLFGASYAAGFTCIWMLKAVYRTQTIGE